MELNYTSSDDYINIITDTLNEITKTHAFRDINKIIKEYVSSVLMINNNESGKEILKILLLIIGRGTYIESIGHNNKTYYQTGNDWGDSYGDDKRNEEYDPDIWCDGYMDGCKYSDEDEKLLEKHKVIPQNNGEAVVYPEMRKRLKKEEIVKYNMDLKHVLDDEITFECIEEELDCEQCLKDEIINKIKSIDYENIDIIIDKKYIKLVNDCGINEDHRGSNHIHINLEFYDSYYLDNLFTFHDLAEAFYKVKSHKFDAHYELYCNSKVNFKDNVIVCNLVFDHGS